MTVCVACLLGTSLAHAGGAKPLPFEALFGGSFTLTDHTGQTRTDADFHGRFLLVSFGYTHCPDICPTTLQLVTDAMDLLGADGARVQPVFITVDPARDDVESLADYVAHFHPRLLALTGTEAQVRGAARAYKVHRQKVLLPDTDPDDYLVDHGSNLYLMGPDGGFLTLFPFRQTDAAGMAATIRKYLAAAPS